MSIKTESVDLKNGSARTNSDLEILIKIFVLITTNNLKISSALFASFIVSNLVIFIFIILIVLIILVILTFSMVTIVKTLCSSYLNIVKLHDHPRHNYHFVDDLKVILVTAY